MVFGLGPVEIAAVVAVGCALEVVLLWAATGLADAPDSSWPKLAAVGLGVFLACFAAACGIAHAFGVLERPTAGESRVPLFTAIGLILAAAFVVPAVVYPPALRVSVRQGVWVSTLQWLLRAFLYVLIAALVMVLLAVFQITPRVVILEAVVTTLGPTGTANVAPMGPRLFAPFTLEVGSAFELKPFTTSRTAANLRHRPEGVMHVTDDVLLLARAAIGDVNLPPAFAATAVAGVVLAGACRAYEFAVTDADTSAERWVLRAEVRAVHRLREFFGLNRAKHAVVEAAILATRTALLPAESVLPEYERLAVLVDKTGGEAEREAFALLRRHVVAIYGVGAR